MIVPTTGSSAFALSAPRIEASMNERSPRGLGVTRANLNLGVSAVGGTAVGAVVGVAAGAAGAQAVTSSATAASVEKSFQNFVFILILLGIVPVYIGACGRDKSVDRASHLLCCSTSLDYSG